MYSRWKSGGNGADTRKKCKKRTLRGACAGVPQGCCGGWGLTVGQTLSDGGQFQSCGGVGDGPALVGHGGRVTGVGALAQTDV